MLVAFVFEASDFLDVVIFWINASKFCTDPCNLGGVVIASTVEGLVSLRCNPLSNIFTLITEPIIAFTYLNSFTHFLTVLEKAEHFEYLC